MIDLQLFKDILGFDSTSGSERLLAEFLLRRLDAPSAEHWELEDGTMNILFSWGRPKVVFCTHMDTVPPYIAPLLDGSRMWGRGSCDAKGRLNIHRDTKASHCCWLAGKRPVHGGRRPLQRYPSRHHILLWESLPKTKWFPLRRVPKVSVSLSKASPSTAVIPNMATAR